MQTHFAQYIIEALKRNKNILVEKPAVTNSSLDIIKELIFKNNIYFTEVLCIDIYLILIM